MTWLWYSILTSVGWGLGQLFLSLALLAPVLALVALEWYRRRSSQRRCPHDNFFETGSCDAVCCACGTNLGFIGTVREDRQARREETAR